MTTCADRLNSTFTKGSYGFLNVLAELIPSDMLFMHELVDNDIASDHAVLKFVLEYCVILVDTCNEYREQVNYSIDEFSRHSDHEISKSSSLVFFG